MSSSNFKLGSSVSLEDLVSVSCESRRVSLDGKTARKLSQKRAVLERAIKGSKPIYGVNTGFGELANRRIPPDQIQTLQRNLILSHACGVGVLLGVSQARGILFLRANELARGFSAIRPELVSLMKRLLNADAVSAIPSQGSVGASGDLAPQAHMALFLIGEGQGFWRGKLKTTKEIFKQLKLKPLTPQAKEGLSLINGTQAMQSVGGLALRQALSIFEAAQIAGALSLEAMTGTPDPFEENFQKLKPHPGQLESARTLRQLLSGSEIRLSHKNNDDRVQDPYSLRCMPQVHGAVKDILDHSKKTLETEMNSITDNPVLLGNRILSGGHFHGQALSFAYDGAAMALTSLGGISERRIAQLISGKSPKLPPFLAHKPGIESGWMIPQVVAAALVSENKVLAHPASADSISTSADKEDFVSMGMGAALKLERVVQNAARIIAIELLAASQGIKAHRPLKPGRGVQKALDILSAEVPLKSEDQVLSSKIEKTAALILAGCFSKI